MKVFVISALFKRVVFSTFRLVVLCLCRLWEELNGVSSQRRQSESPDQYYRSAEILSVRGRNTMCLTDIATLSNFILTHDCFTAPDYVLKKDSISLYFLNDAIAVFCDSGDETPLWDMKHGDFYRISCFLKATKLIVMPTRSFLRLAKTMGDPKGEVLFIGNVTRCGSTLLAHIFAKTGQCSVFSEPESLNCLAKMTRNNRFRSEDEKRELYQATIKMECKPLNSGQPAVNVFKPSGNTIHIDTYIMEYFPQSKHLFLYRNMPDVVGSLQDVLSVIPSATLAYLVNGYNGALDHLMDERFACTNNPYGVQFQSFLEYCTLMPMSCMKHFISNTNERSIPAFRYEDLIQNPREVVTEIFKVTGLNPKYIEKGMTAFNVHSQENSPLAASKLTKTYDSRYKIVTSCEKMMHAAGLPTLSECEVLPGTRCVQDAKKDR